MKKYTLVQLGRNISAESFRLPMAVNEIHLHRNNYAFPVCPRCHLTLDREYQAFCDRCGQALNWKYLKQALLVLVD